MTRDELDAITQRVDGFMAKFADVFRDGDEAALERLHAELVETLEDVERLKRIINEEG